MIRRNRSLERIGELKNCKFYEPSNQPSIDDSLVENSLFRILIENKMNRFLFGYITRVDVTDLDSLLLYENLFEPKKLEKVCGESFIKKFECPYCGHLLFRKHLHEMGTDNYFEEECPNCSKMSIFKYSDLCDDFKIKKQDIIKFLERLVEINFFSKSLVSYCNVCTTSEIISPDEEVGLSCGCGNLREIKFKYESNYPFLTKGDGYWFEWYVYTLCNHIYGSVFQNYTCEFDFNGGKRKCELDVLVISQDNKITVYECKDHMYHLKDKLSMKDFIDNVAKIRHIADKINVVSSLKNVKSHFKDETFDIIEGCEIEFIEGMELERRFLNEDSIINFFENQNYNIVPLYYKLHTRKKRMIFKKITELIIKNESKDYLDIANNLFNRIFPDDIVYPEYSLLKRSLNVVVENISNNKFVVESLEYIKNLYFRKADIFDEEFDLNNILKIGTPFLTSDPSVGYKMRAPFYYFISSYFRNEKIDLSSLDEEIVQQFLLKFVPMLKIYYGVPSLKDTLNVFKKLWMFRNDEIEDSFVEYLMREYSEHVGYKRTIILEFVEAMEHTFSDKNKHLIKSNLT